MTTSIHALGDSCLSLRLGRTIDPEINERAIALAAEIQALALAGIRDIVPAYAAVTVHFDPRVLPRARLLQTLRGLQGAVADGRSAAQEGWLEIPVRYGGTEGPDLPAVAQYGGCSEAEAVALHSARVYRVYMLGFLPGFAYMGDVDERIAAPRLPVPRTRVEAGSVGIAGRQTGIYPSASPGGWRIVGCTSLALFDERREEPCLLRPGQRVRFVPV